MNLYKYWIEQVESLEDVQRTTPILIVGTHADQLHKQDRAKLTEDIQQKFPISTSPLDHTQVCGHFSLSITSGTPSPPFLPSLFLLFHFLFFDLKSGVSFGITLGNLQKNDFYYSFLSPFPRSTTFLSLFCFASDINFSGEIQQLPEKLFELGLNHPKRTYGRMIIPFFRPFPVQPVVLFSLSIPFYLLFASDIVYLGEVQQLQEKLFELGLNHPKIGAATTKVPRSLVLLQQEFHQIRRQGVTYVLWKDFAELREYIPNPSPSPFCPFHIFLIFPVKLSNSIKFPI